MKCITNGTEIRRVSDKEAEHYISREGWHFCQKKKKENRYVCQKCGAKYSDKPGQCSAKIKVHTKNKDGADVSKKTICGCKQFVLKEVFVPVWK